MIAVNRAVFSLMFAALGASACTVLESLDVTEERIAIEGGVVDAGRDDASDEENDEEPAEALALGGESGAGGRFGSGGSGGSAPSTTVTVVTTAGNPISRITEGSVKMNSTAAQANDVLVAAIFLSGAPARIAPPSASWAKVSEQGSDGKLVVYMHTVSAESPTDHIFQVSGEGGICMFQLRPMSGVLHAATASETRFKSTAILLINGVTNTGPGMAFVAAGGHNEEDDTSVIRPKGALHFTIAGTATNPLYCFASPLDGNFEGGPYLLTTGVKKSFAFAANIALSE